MHQTKDSRADGHYNNINLNNTDKFSEFARSYSFKINSESNSNLRPEALNIDILGRAQADSLRNQIILSDQ